MTYTKSQAAFIMSVQKLFDIGDKVYFWTFTFKDVYPDWYYPAAWNKFITSIGNLYGGYINGLRVIEAHPGGHGLHYHLLVNRRICIHFVRRFAERVGMFWIDVRPAWPDIGNYLAKYLTKKSPKVFGVRRWHSVGCFRSVRVNDIEINSKYMRARRRIVHRNKLVIGREQLLSAAFQRGGYPLMKLSYNLLQQGQASKAAQLACPGMELSEKGGLRKVISPRLLTPPTAGQLAYIRKDGSLANARFLGLTGECPTLVNRKVIRWKATKRN